LKKKKKKNALKVHGLKFKGKGGKKIQTLCVAVKKRAVIRLKPRRPRDRAREKDARERKGNRSPLNLEGERGELYRDLERLPRDGP